MRKNSRFVFTAAGLCQKGFTMIEMMVVLSIIGCFTLFGIQGMLEMAPGARINRAVREAASLLEWTRWQAVRQGVVFRVAFDSSEESIIVYRVGLSDEGEEVEREVKRLDLRKKYRGVLLGSAIDIKRTSGCDTVNASGVHFTGQAVNFHPTGTADRNGSLYFIPEKDLVDRREDRMRAVSVLLTTARVALWKFDPFLESECNDYGAWVSF